MPDASPDGAVLPDAAADAARDAVSPDAGTASCNVEVTFAATPVGATYLNVLPLASGCELDPFSWTPRLRRSSLLKEATLEVNRALIAIV